MQLFSKKGSSPSTFDPTCCCWSLLHPSKKKVPFNDALSNIPVSDQLVAGGVVNHLTSRSLRNSSMQMEFLTWKALKPTAYPKEIQLQPTNLRRNLQITFNTHTHKNLEATDFSWLRWSTSIWSSMALGSSILNEKNIWDCFGPLSISMGSNISYTIILSIYTLYIYMCHGINCNLWISDGMVPESHQPSSRGFYTSHNVFWLPIYGLLTVTHLPHNKYHYHVVAYISRIKQVPFVHWV